MLEPHSSVQHCTVQHCTALHCTAPCLHIIALLPAWDKCAHMYRVLTNMLEVTCFASISTAQRDTMLMLTLLNSSESCNN